MKCGGVAIRVSLDTSLLSHALISHQRTESAVNSLDELRREGHDPICADSMFVEFTSLLRKFVNQQRLSGQVAAVVLDELLEFRIELIPVHEALVRRAFEIATQLGQSDTFDAMGYAVAEAEGGEFWTSDQRFANAAHAQGLAGVRLFD